MSTLSLERVRITGLEATYSAAAALGDAVRCGRGVFLHVVNADVAVPREITLNDPTSRDPGDSNQFDPDVVVSVAASGNKLIGPITDRFRDPADGLAHWTYDDESDLTVAAIVLPFGTGVGAVSGSVLATQKLSVAGIIPSYTAAAAGQKIKPGPRTFLHVKNAHNADHTITMDDPTSVSPVGASAFNPDVAVVVTQAEQRFIGPFDARFFDSADTGRGDITWSATTSMSIAVLSL